MNTIADALAYLTGDLSAAHRLDSLSEAEDQPKVSVSLPADVNVEFKILPPNPDEEVECAEEPIEDETAESTEQSPLGFANPLDINNPVINGEDDAENEARFLTLDDLK